MDQGYKVEWDGDDITEIVNNDEEIYLKHNPQCSTSITTINSEEDDLACMTIKNINATLRNRLTISKVIPITGLYIK